MPLVSCVFLSQRLYVSGAAPLGEAAGGGAGAGRGSTWRLLSEALPANCRACESRLSKFHTNDSNGYAGVLAIVCLLPRLYFPAAVFWSFEAAAVTCAASF